MRRNYYKRRKWKKAAKEFAVDMMIAVGFWVMIVVMFRIAY